MVTSKKEPRVHLEEHFRSDGAKTWCGMKVTPTTKTGQREYYSWMLAEGATEEEASIPDDSMAAGFGTCQRCQNKYWNFGGIGEGEW